MIPQRREQWIGWLERVARLPLEAAARRGLRQTMPVEAPSGDAAVRAAFSHLEALGRTLAGVAPWLESRPADPGEESRRRELAAAAVEAIRSATDPDSPDFCKFTTGPGAGQPLVDAAFLAHAIVRAPRTLGEELPPEVRGRLVQALKTPRDYPPPFNNWLLFSAMIEAGLFRLGEKPDLTRVDYALHQHQQWYKGDGAYGDGPWFHWDFYNSFVIQPMLLDVVETLPEHGTCRLLQEAIHERARRYAAVLERFVAPDGSFPPLGRSLAYRGGAFQLLAQMALREELPEGVSPAQTREALTAVIERTLEAPATFDANGWLRPGLAGYQPALAEPYISTGSLYLCSTIFLPLGLPASRPFWSDPPAPWTSRRVWGGENVSRDGSIKA